MNALMTMNRPRIEIANPIIIQKVFIENGICFISGREVLNVGELKLFEKINTTLLLNY